jgi:DNA-binding MarR family transcriptional regulator
MAEVLKGYLSQINIMDLLALLTNAKHSGRLSLGIDEEEGSIFLDRGDICAANIGEQKGYDALLKLTTLTEGRFSFRDKLTTPERHFRESTKTILENVNTELQTFVPVKALQNKVLSLIPRDEEITLQPPEWIVVALSQKQLSLSEIAKEARIDINKVFNVVNKLENQGLVRLQDKEKTVPEEKGERYTPPLFWKTLKTEMAALIGPIAETVIEDEIEGLGELKENFPYDKIPILIERVSEEIDNSDKKTAFQKKTLEILKHI